MNFERIFYIMLSNSAPIILCVLGGNYAHKANVLNISLEGMMLVGAFASVLFVSVTESLLLGALVGIIITLVFGLIFAFMCVTQKGNPIIIGLAINLLAFSITAFLDLKSIFRLLKIFPSLARLLADIPWSHTSVLSVFL